MKICRYEYKSEINYGFVKNDLVLEIKNFGLNPQASLFPQGERVNLSAVKLLQPVIPSKIVCVGRNYVDHAKELGNEVPREPLLFLKAPSAITVSGEPIVLPTHSNQVEHEGELGVVISKTFRKLGENDDPFEFVLGYVCLNDVTARDLQRSDIQFTRAKSFDTFCPISEFIETDLDISNVRVLTRVNGIVKQDARTSQMVFPVPFLLRYISNQMTLNAGDIIATGTPAGVSQLHDGDMCEVEVEGVGILKNPVITMENL